MTEWKLVPVEPTEEMIEAHFAAHARAKTVFADVPEIWRAMLNAAPASPCPENGQLRAALEQIRTLARGPHPPKALEHLADIYCAADNVLRSPENGQNGWRDDMENAPKDGTPPTTEELDVLQFGRVLHNRPPTKGGA